MTRPLWNANHQDAASSDTVCLTEDVITTETAADRVGVSRQYFRLWALRRGLTAIRHVQVGRGRYAVWSLEQVLEADRLGHTTPSPRPEGHTP